MRSRAWTIVVGGSGLALTMPFVLDDIPRWGWIIVAIACWMPSAWVYRSEIAGFFGMGALRAAATQSPAKPSAPSDDADSLAVFVSAIVILMMLGGAGYGLSLLDWSNPTLKHPTLSSAEQERSIADCEMRAAEAIQGGAMKDNDRREYKENCLITEGFRWVEEPPADDRKND